MIDTPPSTPPATSPTPPTPASASPDAPPYWEKYGHKSRAEYSDGLAKAFLAGMNHTAK